MAQPISKSIAGLYVSEGRKAEVGAALPSGSNVDRAIVAAINKTLTAVRRGVETALTAQYSLPKKNLKRRLYIQRASQGRNSGKIYLYARAFPLINFNVQDTGRNTKGGRRKGGTGVSAEVKRGAPFNLPHAFIAKTAVRGLQVFQRTKLGPGSDRRKITLQKSQRLIDLFRDTPMYQSLDAIVHEELDRQIDSEVDRQIYRGF